MLPLLLLLLQLQLQQMRHCCCCCCCSCNTSAAAVAVATAAAAATHVPRQHTRDDVGGDRDNSSAAKLVAAVVCLIIVAAPTGYALQHIYVHSEQEAQSAQSAPASPVGVLLQCMRPIILTKRSIQTGAPMHALQKTRASTARLLHVELTTYTAQ
jgi:hypothetical protein